MKKYFLLLVASLFMVAVSCEKEDVKNDDPPVIEDASLTTSFENETDMDKWDGLGLYTRVEGGAPGGGDWSLSIRGCCAGPHAFYKFGPFEEDKVFSLKCFAKVEDGCEGNISLNVGEELIMLSITDTVWTAFEHNDTIVVPAGKGMKLIIDAISPVAKELRVDLLEVEEVNQ